MPSILPVPHPHHSAAIARRCPWVEAHGWIFEHENGELPEGQCVLHHCDLPECVNEDRLFAGTRRDNCLNMCAELSLATSLLLPGQKTRSSSLSRNIPNLTFDTARHAQKNLPQ
jgi:hypothetical protein